MIKISAIIIGLSLPCFSQSNPTSSSVMDFSGGLNTLSAPIYLPINESPNLMNVVIDEPLGALTQRKGYTLCGHIPSGLTATNLYEFSKTDGSKSLIVTDNITIWSTPDCSQWQTIVTGLNQLFIPRFTTANDKLWIVNGSTWTSTWDGSTLVYLNGVSTPLAPKGRYITFWKNRIWIASPTTDPSAVSFNSLTDSLGNILDPTTSTDAWLSTNLIYFGKNDGSPIYGLFGYRDNLMVFKERSLWRLLWESELNLQVIKAVSTIGSKFQDSIVEMDDGTLRYVGIDGIYAYNGTVRLRMSTKITPTFYSFKQPTRNEQSKIWDTPIDFIAGTFLNSSTTSVGVALSTDYFGTNANIGSEQCVTGGANSVGWVASASGGAESPSIALCSVFMPTRWGVWNVNSVNVNESVNCLNAVVYVRKSSDDSMVSSFTITNSVNTSTVSLVYGTSYYIIGNQTGAGCIDYLKSPIFSNINTIVIQGQTRNVGITPNISNQIHVDVKNMYRPSGTYTTQITTATGLSQWGIFDTAEATNGQTLTYDIRTATSVYNIGLKSYRSISPGSIISTNTAEIYSQIRANLATTDNSKTPIIDRLSIGWITGDTSISTIKGLVYKSRYWLTGSTQPSNAYNDTTLVESRPPLGSYTLFNIPISAMTLWSGNLYAAISSTDTIVRLDNGTNDNGVAISSFWESKDQIYDNPVKYKSINYGLLDYAGIPTTLSVMLSPDSGNTWQSRDVVIPSGPRSTSKLNYDANMSQAFRTRIQHSILDATYQIYGVHTIGSITDFIGQ